LAPFSIPSTPFFIPSTPSLHHTPQPLQEGQPGFTMFAAQLTFAMMLIAAFASAGRPPMHEPGRNAPQPQPQQELGHELDVHRCLAVFDEVITGATQQTTEIHQASEGGTRKQCLSWFIERSEACVTPALNPIPGAIRCELFLAVLFGEVDPSMFADAGAKKKTARSTNAQGSGQGSQSKHAAWMASLEATNNKGAFGSGFNTLDAAFRDDNAADDGSYSQGNAEAATSGSGPVAVYTVDGGEWITTTTLADTTPTAAIVASGDRTASATTDSAAETASSANIDAADFTLGINGEKATGVSHPGTHDDLTDVSTGADFASISKSAGARRSGSDAAASGAVGSAAAAVVCALVLIGLVVVAVLVRSRQTSGEQDRKDEVGGSGGCEFGPHAVSSGSGVSSLGHNNPQYYTVGANGVGHSSLYDEVAVRPTAPVVYQVASLAASPSDTFLYADPVSSPPTFSQMVGSLESIYAAANPAVSSEWSDEAPILCDKRLPAACSIGSSSGGDVAANALGGPTNSTALSPPVCGHEAMYSTVTMRSTETMHSTDNGFVLDGEGMVRVASVVRANPVFCGSIYQAEDAVGGAGIVETSSM
jgi:hypothetical protein